ncbi:uncharacterized protein ACN427_000983 isoform 1-T1 [Glossina fuscipes fuscipes]
MCMHIVITMDRPTERISSREFREKAKSNLEEKFKAAIDSNHDKSISENRGYIEKEDTCNVNETLVPSNQCKTGISENWDEDDDDLFASIILDQNEKINNSANGNKQIIQNITLIFLTLVLC